MLHGNSLSWICAGSFLLVSLNLAAGTTISKFPMVVTLPDSVLSARATANRDIRYDVWSNPQRILFRLDDIYNDTQKALIREAMAQIQRDMSSCIRFEPYNIVTDSREDHLVISPNLNPGANATTCVTFPGRVIRQNAAGQKLVIFQSVNGGGCMGSKRETMAIIVPVLGLRQEIKRPDRDQHVRVFPDNVLPAFQNLDLLTKYEAASVDAASAFDFLSITMPSASRFAKADTLVYTPRNATQLIGEFARLSQGDCQGIKRIYPGCTRIRCSDPYEGVSKFAAPSTVSPAVSSEVDAAAVKDITKDGAGAVISAAFAAINRPTTTTHRPTRSKLNGTSTTPLSKLTLLEAFDGLDDAKPLDPPFGGLEFWLDPAKKNIL